jgi:hypothetical protein
MTRRDSTELWRGPSVVNHTPAARVACTRAQHLATDLTAHPRSTTFNMAKVTFLLSLAGLVSHLHRGISGGLPGLCAVVARVRVALSVRQSVESGSRPDRGPATTTGTH